MWTITFLISRQRTGEKPHFQSFSLQVDPDEYVLDAIERAWAFHDRSLTFRHACHHSTCGACGMLVNGVEKLTCITPIHAITHDGGTVRVEPLRNFPVVSDLVVDMVPFFERMEQIDFQQVVPVEKAALPHQSEPQRDESGDYTRLVDCIECGLCISACPPASTSASYLGPAALAAIQQNQAVAPCLDLLALADSENGVWRCHSAFECSAVCPSNVDPAWRIMDLRRRTFGHRLQQLFSKGRTVSA